MPTFIISLAGLSIGVHSRFDYLRRFCRDYLSESKVSDFSVSVGDERLLELRAASPDICDELLERDEIYSEIAAKLPRYNRVMLHGACISYENKAYLFTAPSGAGKSTHIGLWHKYLGDNVTIINGDKPIFYIRESGSVHAFGTPWCGKEGWNRNESADLAGICFLGRGIENKICPVKPDEAAPLLLRQMFLPKESGAAALTLGLLDKIVSAIPAYLLECDISENAVRTSFEALTGEKYQRFGRTKNADCNINN